MKIAVVGSGISGLYSAWQLSQSGHEVALFEANDYFGGHTHTVDVQIEGISHGVDTGFLVFNERTYPNLIALFDHLNVQTTGSDMSFSVKLLPDSTKQARSLEWAGANLSTVFVQKRNLFNLRFWRMLRDILRFNRQTTALASQHQGLPAISLGDFLTAYRYSQEFRDWYLLPMAGCIWSCPTEQMLAFPLASFVTFCHNHGLLQIADRPKWFTVTGGAKNYVEKMLAGIQHKHLNSPVLSVKREDFSLHQQVRLQVQGSTHLFDHVVLATHSDQTLAMLSDVREEEKNILSAITYQPNQAILHTDTRCLPADKAAWSAWNYESLSGAEPRVCVHYLLNKLQPLPFTSPVIVSLNPLHEPDPEKIIGRYDYAHPVFDAAAIAAQQSLQKIQGKYNTWFAGAWTGYGFHEDGLKSGINVSRAITQLSAHPTSARART